MISNSSPLIVFGKVFKTELIFINMKQKEVNVVIRTFSILFLVVSFALTLFLFTTMVLDPRSTGELTKVKFFSFVVISFVPWALLCWGLWKLNNHVRMLSVIISMIFIGLLIAIIAVSGYVFINLNKDENLLQGPNYRAVNLFSLTALYSSVALIVIYSLFVYFMGFNEEIKEKFGHKGKKLKTLFT
jgi:hypothetical protein